MFRTGTSYGKWALVLGLLGFLVWWIGERESPAQARQGPVYRFAFGSGSALSAAVPQAVQWLRDRGQAECEPIDVESDRGAGGLVEVVLVVRCP